MKNKIKFGAIVAFAALFSNAVMAQTDTVKVIKETQVIRDTVVKEKLVPVEEVKPERPALRVGELGVRYMPTFSSLSLRDYNGNVIQGELTMSQGFGVMMGLNFSKNIGLQAEVSYLEISQKYKDRNLDRQVGVSYLNIPVMLSVNTDKTRMVNLNFVAGPQFGVNLGSSVQTTGNETSGTLRATVGAKGTDVGLAYGTGLEVALSQEHCLRLDFGYRGFYGLIDGSANQTSSNPDTYNVLVRGSRQTHGAYLGLTWCF